jgi:hypothetical protein
MGSLIKPSYGVTIVDLVIDDLCIFLQTLHVKLYVFNAHLLVKTSDKIHVSRKILLSTTTTSTVMLLTMVVSTLHAKNLHFPLYLQTFFAFFLKVLCCMFLTSDPPALLFLKPHNRSKHKPACKSIRDSIRMKENENCEQNGHKLVIPG